MKFKGRFHAELQRRQRKLTLETIFECLLLDFELKSVNSKQTSRFRALLPAVKICQDLLGQNRFLMVKVLKPKELDFSYSVISVTLW